MNRTCPLLQERWFQLGQNTLTQELRAHCQKAIPEDDVKRLGICLQSNLNFAHNSF